MSRRCRTSKWRANTKVAGVQRAGARRAHTSQYQHFIPRFILRRFQVGIPKSRKERNKEFKRTGVDPEYILYYDVATGSLDTRPIGKVYGVLGIYQDVHNTRNINELEDKLARLESQAASIIENLHKALPQGILALKYSSLVLLRKFLFLMHFRNESHSSRAFEVDRPENVQARQWVERILKADGIRSAADVWRHILRYYLDSSHSDLMRHAANVVESGGEGLQETHIPPVTYRTYMDDYFLSIWEAAQGEEFILTHNAFGLSEGSATSCPALHRIFVLSPRIAVVLCNVRLRPETKRHRRPRSLESSLLDVNLALPVPIYTAEEGGIQLFSHQRPSWETKIDGVVFKITKLTRSQTLELNSVVLFNLEKTGSLTFRSGTRMLRTAHAFRSNFPSSRLVVPLIAHLTTSLKSEEASALCSSVKSLTASPDEDFDPLSLGDLVLDVLLMQICSGRKQFPSAYDRAHFVLKIMAKAKPTSFARRISRKVRRAFRACKGDMEDGMSFAEGVNPAPLVSSIPRKLSSQLFELMIPYMRKRGAEMSGGEETLEVLQRDVAVVSFLQRASCNPGVWHALSHSSPEAPKILSKLFKKGTPADEFIAKISPSGFSSCYNRAYSLRKVYGMAGPTTSPISQRYYGLTAFIIEYFDFLAMLGVLPEPYFSQPCKRRKAQLVHIMPRAHSDLPMKRMKEFLREELEEYESEYESGEDTLDETTKEWVDEMAIVGCLAWLGKHRRNIVNFILDGFPSAMNLELFEGESHWEYLN
ncbi:uncharacterized protein F5147DRAFT_836813 [Suillus discolor]|uniref:Uncharacterized protein n=1 Tax=Suillus discolor TaxID=1912936 RepID=A0A9P7F6Q7_9AGAM|nr:uncharacterized protein F5147DRAFT_836813 [Suillus discolor]KAG2108946.1 hypothetical protein F5147DRAFT_836813 [Suillus discolor]